MIRNEVVEILPPVYALPDFSVLGTGSVFLPNLKTRVIKASNFVEIAGFQGTQQSITRQWMRESLKPRKAKKKEIDAGQFSRAPMYASPATLESAQYIDIKSAYHSIYSNLGWGVDYLRGGYLAASPEPLVYPFRHALKVGRSYVVTGAKPKIKLLRVYNGVAVEKECINPFSNPSLISATLDVLSAIARFSVYAFGAIYYNTDGAILPKEKATHYKEFLLSLGLLSSVKGEGRAWVANVTNWAIGDKIVRYGAEGSITAGDWIPIGAQAASWVIERYLDVLKWRNLGGWNTAEAIR